MTAHNVIGEQGRPVGSLTTGERVANSAESDWPSRFREFGSVSRAGVPIEVNTYLFVYRASCRDDRSRRFLRVKPMWCSHCRQDVPGISSAKGRISCAHCASQLPAEDQPDTAIGADLTDAVDVTDRTDLAAPIGLYPSFEDWQTDQAFHHLQARVGNWKRSGTRTLPGAEPRTAQGTSIAHMRKYEPRIPCNPRVVDCRSLPGPSYCWA